MESGQDPRPEDGPEEKKPCEQEWTERVGGDLPAHIRDGRDGDDHHEPENSTVRYGGPGPPPEFGLVADCIGAAPAHAYVIEPHVIGGKEVVRTKGDFVTTDLPEIQG